MDTPQSENQSQVPLLSLFPLGCLCDIECFPNITFLVELLQGSQRVVLVDVKRNGNQDIGHTAQECTNLYLEAASQDSRAIIVSRKSTGDGQLTNIKLRKAVEKKPTRQSTLLEHEDHQTSIELTKPDEISKIKTLQQALTDAVSKSKSS